MMLPLARRDHAQIACALCVRLARRSAARQARAAGHGRRDQHAGHQRAYATASSQRQQQHEDGDRRASTSSDTANGPQSTAAAHLLAQARIEEADLSPAASISTRIQENQRKEVPWMGEESIEDAVLRMLIDKHKPLRVSGHQRKIQQPSSEPITFKPVETPPADIDPANRITDQSHPDYKWQPGDKPRHPWEIIFKAPANSQGTANIKSGVITPSSNTHNAKGRPSAGQVAARVFLAKDASIDYASGSRETARAKAALGTKGGNTAKNKAQSGGLGYRPMPTSIKAWNNIVDERIELARQQGVFSNLKGRGKPLVRDPDESNPYVERTEFLMNRIVKRQEAAPPFVELQREMRDEVQGFRARLRQAWIRRATRVLSMQPMTPSVISQCGEFRDGEWEAREQAYHETSVTNINSIIRKYNIVAPPPVRSPVTSVASELQACYRDCAPLIKEELERRAKAGHGALSAGVVQGPGLHGGPKGKLAPEEAAVRETMLSAFRRFVKETFARA